MNINDKTCCLKNFSNKIFLIVTLMILVGLTAKGQINSESIKNKPLRLGIIGLAHVDVHGVFQSVSNPDIEIVGIAEPDTALVAQFIKQYHINPRIIYKSVEELIAKAKPEAVSVYTSVSDHINVVRICAPHKIHVMVNKPLALNYQEALEMKKLSKKWGIEIITNYETTWFPVTKEAYVKIVQDKLIGEPVNFVFHYGHKGLIEVGCSKEFTNWLTDPAKNGGGAIIDLGCYGTDIMSYIMNGERPVSVTAITEQIRPDLYPKVDDQATIIVNYSRAQGVIQASWNWPFNRKDMEIYGKTGYISTSDMVHMKMKTSQKSPEEQLTISSDKAIANNPFSFFASVVRGKIKLAPNDPSSLDLNLVAMEILNDAVISAKEGKTIYLKH